MRKSDELFQLFASFVGYKLENLYTGSFTYGFFRQQFVNTLSHFCKK